MSITRLSPADLSVSPSGNPQVLIATGTRFITINGQVGRDPSGALVGGGDHILQAGQAFRNVKDALAGAGASGLDVTHYRLTIVGYEPHLIAGILDAGREVFGVEWFNAPSIMVGAVALGRPDLLVEIEAIAVLD